MDGRIEQFTDSQGIIVSHDDSYLDGTDILILTISIFSVTNIYNEANHFFIVKG